MNGSNEDPLGKGTFVGLTCADRVLHKHYADFDFFSYEADEEKGVPAPEEE